MHYSWHTSLLIFVSGFSILSLEFIGIRLFAPYLGTTIPVWANLMGVILLANTIGYYGGGIIADRFSKGEHILLMGLITGVTIFIIPYTRFLIALLATKFPYGIASFIASFLVFFIPVALLSAVTIAIIRSSTISLETISEAHGNLYAMATIGSLGGVFITSYFLIPYFALPTITSLLGIFVILATLFFHDARQKNNN